jgi:hypothetical protein
MRTLIAVILSLPISGCIVSFQGVLTNSSDQTVYHLTAWKPFEEPIAPKDTKRINFQPLNCLELIIGGESRFFVPPSAPDDVFNPRLFSVDVALLYEATGLYYESKEMGLVKFSEVKSCDT